MRAFTACLLALCLAQGAMAAKKQQVTFSPPPPPGPQDFIAPGVSACRRAAAPRLQAADCKPSSQRPLAPSLQMDFSFIIPGYTAATFTQTQANAVCAVLKAKAGGECIDAPGAVAATSPAGWSTAATLVNADHAG